MRLYKIISRQKHALLKSFPKVYNIIDNTNIPFLTQNIVTLSNSFSSRINTLSEIYPKDIVKYITNQEENVNAIIHREVLIILNIIKSRSNVGKSSIINKILDQEITKTSKEPGKTNYLQVINLPSFELSLVDCPGYGYANRSISERKKWDLMMNVYFGSSKRIERILVLIDSVVGMCEMDHEIFKMAQSKGINFNIVFTKIDKLKKPSDIQTILKNAKDSIMKYKFYSPFVVFTSSKLGLGITELKCLLIFSKFMNDQMTNRVPPQ